MKWHIHLALLASVSLPTACGGGGAGDVINASGENTAGPGLVERFVGVWQLTSGWSSRTTDEALLVIREPDQDGRAQVVLYDFTDEADVDSQCYRAPFGNDTAFDSATNEVFLDSTVFTQGILSSVNENTMSISFVDADDINGNGDTKERLSTSLSRVGQTEDSISPAC